MKINELNFMVGGTAGEGVDLPGTLFGKLCMSAGLRLKTNAEFHSVIKGYNNIYQIRASENPVYSHMSKYDLVLALDKDTTDLYMDDVVPGGGVIYDPDITKVEREGVKLFPVPLRAIAKEKVGLELAKNVVGIGAACGLLDYPIDILLDLLIKTFARKGKEITSKNIDAAQAGYNYVRENFPKEFDYIIKPKKNPEKTFMANGNYMITFGAIKAGCKFVSEYPMTPSSSVLHCMAKHAREYEISVNHVEDELSAINMAIGAGFSGCRSMAATSGGGFSLMTEAVGFAGMTEIPIVIVEVQRPGPSTGLPTRSGQGDLRQVLHASQGDFPKIVLSPGTHEEAFYMAFEAFNLAEMYQCPVILLTEKYLGEGDANIPFPDTTNLKINRGQLLDDNQIDDNFLRYKNTKNGISPRSIPGQKGGAHTASSYEHREDGYFTEEIDECNSIHERRMRKLDTLKNLLPPVVIEGKENAEVTLVCWGATYGPAYEAIEWLKKKGISANLLHVKYLSPLQPGINEALSKTKRPILIEGNITAQLGGLIAEKVGIDIQSKILDYSGRPFTPDQIAREVIKIIK
ncbi:2-oxoacid:acceptor oxidoreductase subunit alpha [Candidatus Peregrinibacteria bacterium]|nr:2-oxoacid:acceptor oxidoreductase subunit alpha [Candidatus Peregrinibacteria bacterium]